VVMRSDPAGNLKPDKERSDDKIDGYVAATMGWARWMFGRGRRRRSAYATRDMVVI
jgi:phage terminase large subunit-like protein